MLPEEKNKESALQDQPQTSLLHCCDISSFTCLKWMKEVIIQAVTSHKIFFRTAQPSAMVLRNREESCGAELSCVMLNIYSLCMLFYFKSSV